MVGQPAVRFLAILGVALALLAGSPRALAQEVGLEEEGAEGAEELLGDDEAASDEEAEASWREAEEALSGEAPLELYECVGAECAGVDLSRLSLADEAGPYPMVSITPYFPPGAPFHKARAAVEEGRCPEALKALEEARASCGGTCEGARAIQWVESRARWCAGDREGGYAAIRALDEAGYPGMVREVRERHREYARLLGRSVPAEVPPHVAWDGVDFVRRALSQARALAKAGRLEDALRVVDAVERQCRPGALRRQVELSRGLILEASGRDEEAAGVYARIWRAHQGSALGASAEERLRRLEASGRARRVRLTREERLDHLVYMATRRKTSDATLKGLARGLAGRPSERRALDGLIKGIRLEEGRKREKALAELQRAARGTKDPVLLARIQFAQGRALRRLNRDREAIALYLELAERWPRDSQADDALLQAARLLSFLGEQERVLEVVERLVTLYPDSPLRGRAYWQGAWSAWLLGRYDQALRLTEVVARFYGEEEDPSALSQEVKARYWQARILARMGRTGEALEGFRYVAERWPLTYYAAMSYHQIGGLGHDPRAALPFQPRFHEPVSSVRLKELSTFGEVPGHPRVRHGLELWRIGERGRARAALQEQLHFEGVPRGVVELVSTLHLLDDDIPASFHVASRYGSFSTAPYRGNARLWGLAYPSPPKIVEAALDVAQEVDVDPLLALAIIRHESGFQPGARSPVGAVGLMQLMPSTARRVNATWYGSAGPSRAQLNRRETNVRLGMTMLRLLSQVYQENLPLMIAGYNAGTGIASRWYGQFRELETDSLVEQMTYPLTRAYVKKVIGSYYAYRVLYGDGAPPSLPLTLPDHLGEWGPPKPALVGAR